MSRIAQIVAKIAKKRPDIRRELRAEIREAQAWANDPESLGKAIERVEQWAERFVRDLQNERNKLRRDPGLMALVAKNVGEILNPMESTLRMLRRRLEPAMRMRAAVDLLRDARAVLAAKGKVLPKIPDVRKPYYALSDAVVNLHNVPSLRHDGKWTKLLAELENLDRRIHRHLNDNYVWD